MKLCFRICIFILAIKLSYVLLSHVVTFSVVYF